MSQNVIVKHVLKRVIYGNYLFEFIFWRRLYHARDSWSFEMTEFMMHTEFQTKIINRLDMAKRLKLN